MRYIKVFSLFVLLISFGCNEKRPGYQWSTITIISEHDTEIKLNNDGDTSVINVYHIGTYFRPLPKNSKIKVDTFKAYFTTAEKDTIFSLVNDLIVHPVVTNKFCTEYVGSLKLMVDYGQGFKQSGEYSSICNWNKLSDGTIHLYSILRRRMKKIYLGEHDYPL